ncbi:sensor histidine kinase [Nocardia neocaledoniensis]|uniref:sensor histidine kinase n=1 Tax=Nocardia neocaledoniensis TaxID=236511 RepID=UPI002454A101|nr:sensor histidine kinase [Nocardia neocaledoniensis]
MGRSEELRVRAWSARRPAWFPDLLLALFVIGVQVQSAGIPMGAEPVTRPITDYCYTAYVLLALGGALLVFRRRAPVPVFVATGALTVVYFALDFPDRLSCLALFVATYTLAAHGTGRRPVLVAAAGTAVLALAWLIAAADVTPSAAIGWVFFRIGAAVLSITLGMSVRSRRIIAEDAHQRAVTAERLREKEATARVDAERLRIAREVHDTVAHAITIINVQAGVTAHVLDKRPDQARETLRIIEQTSSRALREMRAILGVLRGDDRRAPSPGLAELGDVLDVAGDAGLRITADLPGGDTPLPSAIEDTAYRIVQESITNVIRHVGPSAVTVSVVPGEQVVRILVRDDGGDGTAPLPRPDTAGTGRGITGMRERCRLLGGDLTAQPRAQGGFEVVAHLPLEPAGALA